MTASRPASTSTSAPAAPHSTSATDRPTAALVLETGEAFFGQGFGAVGATVGELCFNTAMTGYQEIMTDPSYAGQIVLFTFPHIGNVGVNVEDEEAAAPAALGMIAREAPTAPSNWRAQTDLAEWLREKGRIGLSGVDTRRLTRRIRALGAPHAAIAHAPDGRLDVEALSEAARAFKGLAGADLARDVTTAAPFDWRDGAWRWGAGFSALAEPKRRIVAVDYGAKRNILRRLVETGSELVVVPATATVDEVLAHRPDGVFLSNGPGDPAATAEYAAPMIRGLLDADAPIFGICLGHQMLALALGARTVKMNHGHHGANHPVKELATGKVEVTSMNHGFAVDAATLPAGVVETHVSLFDGSNCGIAVEGKPVFSVQQHPEASPGPQDSHYLFDRFANAVDAHKAGRV